MKAVIYEDVKSFKCCDGIAEPSITENYNVKIKVMYCGICGSDLHKLLYERPNPGYVKTNTLGHEFVGEIIDLGNCTRTDINVGDIVAVEPLLYCNNCDMCREGKIQFCRNLKSFGRDLQGGFAEYVTVNEKQVYKIKNGADEKKVALSDPYSVAIHIKQLVNESNKKIAIVGDGIIGIATAELLSDNNEVVLFGKHANRRDILNKVNVRYCSLDEQKDFINYFDAVVEAVGGRQNDTLNQAITMTKPKGKIIVSGVFDNKFEFSIPLRNSFYKELSIIGCNSYEKSNDISDFSKAVDYLSNESKIADELVSKTFKIDDFESAIQYIQDRKTNDCIKILIEM